MIDWLTLVVPLEHRRLSGGRLMKFDKDEVLEWESPSRYSHQGSFSTSVVLKSQGSVPGKPEFASELYIDGNLTKYLQGHNVTGPDSVAWVVTEAVCLLCRELNIGFSVFDLYRISRGDFELKRIDVTFSLSAGSSSLEVDTFLDAVADTGGTKYRKAYPDRGTVYFNKGSSRWSSAWYNKEKEVKKRRPPKQLQKPENWTPDRFRNAARLMDAEQYNSEVFQTADQANACSWLYARNPLQRFRLWSFQDWQKVIASVRGCVRIEFRLLSLQLADMELKDGSAWCGGFGESERSVYGVWSEMMERIKIEGNVRLNGDELHDLPGNVRGTYELWRSGVALRELLSRATFYRHKAILRKHGINIDDAPQQKAQVIPIVRYLEAKPVAVELPPEFGGLLRAV